LKLQSIWFDECSELLHQRKQFKLKCLQNQSQTNGDNLSNVRYESSKTFQGQKERIKEPEKKNSKKKISDTYREA
jgi:hypothetical protein